MMPSTGDVSLAAAGAPAAQMAVSAALNGLRAEGFAGSAELALPSPVGTPAAASATASAKPAPIITPEQMAKLLKLLDEKGGDNAFPAVIANPLGLGAPGQAYMARTLAAGDPAGLIRGFAISKGSEQDIVISNVTAGKNAYLYRAHRDGTLVAAIIGDAATQKVISWNVADAQKSYLAEVALWTGMVSAPVTASN
jgi:hypothetical protein